MSFFSRQQYVTVMLSQIHRNAPLPRKKVWCVGIQHMAHTYQGSLLNCLAKDGENYSLCVLFSVKTQHCFSLQNFSRELENVEHAHASVFSRNVDKKVKGSILSEGVNEYYQSEFL